MAVIIAGAGSVGLLLGSFLAEAGLDVMMLVRRKEQAKLLAQKGIERVNEDGTKTVVRVNATTDIAELPVAHFWIVAVKFSDLRGFLAQLKERNMQEPVLFVQNGIGHLALATETDLPHYAFATVEHGALRSDDRVVRHNGIGMLTVGAGRGDATLFNRIEEARSERFPISRHADGEHVLMRKVIINCMINPLTAILQVRNGELLTNQHCRGLFAGLYEELMAAFPEMRPYLPLETVQTVCKNTAQNHSSMLVDRLSGRQMEIATIVTAIIQRAYAVNKTLPLLSTFEKMLYAVDRKEER